MTRTIDKARLDAIAAKIDVTSVYANPQQRREIAFQAEKLKHVEVLAAFVRYFDCQVKELKKSISEWRPKRRELLWKRFNRCLDMYIAEHDRTYQYGLNDTHKARVMELVDELSERSSRGLSLLYFSIRNEIINTDVAEEEIEPVIRCRICDLMLRCFGDCARYMGGVGINEEHALLQDAMRVFSKKESDKGGHQALWRKIFTNTITSMMEED